MARNVKAKARPKALSLEEAADRKIEDFRAFVSVLQSEGVCVVDNGVARDVGPIALQFAKLAQCLVDELVSERNVIERLRGEISELEDQVEKLECVNEEFSDDILKVRALAERVLGRESLDEDLNRFDLRRAVEDLARSVS